MRSVWFASAFPTWKSLIYTLEESSRSHPTSPDYLKNDMEGFLTCSKKAISFGLVCRRLPELKVPNLHFSLMCSISSSEVPTPFGGDAGATELKSSGALVERPLELMLPLPGPVMMEIANLIESNRKILIVYFVKVISPCIILLIQNIPLLENSAYHTTSKPRIYQKSLTL